MANEFEFTWVKMMNVSPTLIEPGRLGFTHTPEEIHFNHNNDINASVLYCFGEMSGGSGRQGQERHRRNGPGHDPKRGRRRGGALFDHLVTETEAQSVVRSFSS
jgi:hypothetical protein